MDYIEQFNYILQSFKIKAKCIDYKKLDNYFFYDLELIPNAKVKDIQKFGDELSLAIRTISKPSIKIIRDQGVVRLEFITPRTKSLNLFDCFTHTPPKGDILCLLGQSVDGNNVWMDLAQNPHMIIAGTTGSGKSTLLHNIIANVCYYSKASLCLIDPKNIEFVEYEKRNLPNTTIAYSYSDAIVILDSFIECMEYRYYLLRNNFDMSKIPYGVLIIDEFADLIMQDKNDDFYNKLCRLSQKCRAAKISIILATQRPSVNIIDGTIKANFPARIACRTASHIDSRVILDSVGAENLLGYGDALLRDNFRFLDRFQVAYTNSTEVCNNFCNE